MCMCVCVHMCVCMCWVAQAGHPPWHGAAIPKQKPSSTQPRPARPSPRRAAWHSLGAALAWRGARSASHVSARWRPFHFLFSASSGPPAQVLIGDWGVNLARGRPDPTQLHSGAGGARGSQHCAPPQLETPRSWRRCPTPSWKSWEGRAAPRASHSPCTPSRAAPLPAPTGQLRLF